jgi:two-component system OmpR family response regulator
MERTPHILVVDDHREIRELLAKYLAKNGFRVSVANGGGEMRQVLRAGAVDLVVLDIMMPGEDGLTLCRQLRQSSDVPVVLLTAVSEETDRIVGLELGADDYVTKPFSPRELLARVRAILRRVSAAPKLADEGKRQRLRFGGWTLDVARHALLDAAGEETALGSAEFKLLHALVTRPGLVLTRDQLLDITAGRNAQAFDRSIDNLVSRLRRRIEPDPAQPTLIKTVWGDGYMFAAAVEDAP